MRTGRALAAILLGVGLGVLVQPGPAAAAACSSGSGVTVVVGSSTSCDVDGGVTAADNFRNVGHDLTPVTRLSGFVCQVDGAPKSANCANTPPSNAYWGLFWSDGSSGKWSYASEGVGTLKVPKDGWVAFVFQTSSSKTYPGVTPIGPAVAPSTSSASTGSGQAKGATTAPDTSADSGELGWVAGGLAVVLLGGMGVIVWRRKAAGSS